jgi:FixJ family two-component response regulator
MLANIVTETEAYRNSLTENEKRVLEIERTFVVPTLTQKQKAEKLDISPSTYSKRFWSAKLKLFRLGTVTQKEI